ncbi:MAG: transglutaminase-like domain-containing protein [Acidobacteria bacterium]|nr:transglutaminase-like domain-containing protein [Acidobacteriota bacterium]
MTDPDGPHRGFSEIVSLPDEAIDLAQASLLIAREEYPGLRIGDYLAQMDEMAASIRSRLRGGEGFTSLVAHVNRLLFDELGFRGNREEYYDPRNSFLNDVLDRRVGIPISLSTIYLEVARRIGLRLAGVTFPGHFLVRYVGRDMRAEILIDPFNRGILLTEVECRHRLDELFQGQIPFRQELLRRASKRDILERILMNLRSIYQGQRDFHRALRIQKLLIDVQPGRPAAIRDRGLLYYRLACLGQAAHDLRSYLKAAPSAPDAGNIQSRLDEISRLAPRMN